MKKTITTKITKVYKSEKNKAGDAFVDKNGKPFWKVAIKTEATGDKYYSCLAFREDDAVMKLTEGSSHTLLVWEENGFDNFKVPSKTDLLEDRVNALENIIYKSSLAPKLQGTVHTDIDYPEEDINPEDIPF